MLKCYGDDCPIKADCYRYTQPYTKRNAFGRIPYDYGKENCDYFYSNLPTDESVRETAYYLWLQQGKPANKALEHWRQAYHHLCLTTGRMK